jgi:hypothetical protein
MAEEKTEFVVAGFSKKHRYYRTQIGRFDTEEEALSHLRTWLSKLNDENKYWTGVSTVIVEVRGEYQKRHWACSCKNTKSKIYPKGDRGSFIAY